MPIVQMLLCIHFVFALHCADILSKARHVDCRLASCATDELGRTGYLAATSVHAMSAYVEHLSALMDRPKSSAYPEARERCCGVREVL